MSDADKPATPRLEHAFTSEVFNPDESAHTAWQVGVGQWSQGDILKGVPMFWAAPAGVDPVTGIELDPVEDGSMPVAVWDGRAAVAGVTLAPISWESTHSIVTSQTCDVGPTGPGARHPTVQVSPCERYDHLSENAVMAIERGEVVDLVPVPGLGPGKWAANLRLSIPVSKTALASTTPTAGFDSEDALLEFADRVAEKQRRPALHDELIDGTTVRLQELVRAARKRGESWVDEIEQFRLTIIGGTRLKPKKVCILAITLSVLSQQDRRELREWRTAEDRRLQKVPSEVMSMAPMRFVTVERVDVREYRDAVWLRIPALNQSMHF